MNERRYRVGIVGGGFGGSVHVPALRAQGRFDVVAIASPASAAEVARERSIPHAFASAVAMLDAVELDVVTVASPPFDHHVSVLAALARGKHVLCEKPMALSVPQAEEMLAAAERAGVVAAIAHEFRFLPIRMALHELVTNEHLGALRQIECVHQSGEQRTDVMSSRAPWWYDRTRGGGPAQAMLSHQIDAANWLAGRPIRSVRGFSRIANPLLRAADGTPFESTVEDGAFALIDYGDGLVARLALDTTLAIQSSLVAVHGSLRTAVASGRGVYDATLFAVDADETSELAVKPDPRAKLAAAHPAVPPFAAMLDAFVAAMDGAPERPFATFTDGLATQRVLEAVGYGSD